MIATRFNPLGIEPMYQSMRYVQEGLIAQWDGIENNGRGKHSETITDWVDLVGGRNIHLDPACIIEDNAISYTIAKAVEDWDGIENFGGITDDVFGDDFVDGKTFYHESVWATEPISQWRAHFAFLCKRGNAHATLNRRGVRGSSLTNGTYARYQQSTVATLNQYVSAYGIAKFNGVDMTNTHVDGNRSTIDGRVRIFGATITGTQMRLAALRFYNRIPTEEEMNINLAIDIERYGIQV